MQIALALLYTVLTGSAIGGSVVAVCGGMNDYSNRYPLPMLLAAVVAGGLGQALLRLV